MYRCARGQVPTAQRTCRSTDHPFRSRPPPAFLSSLVLYTVRAPPLPPQLFHFRESGRREISTFSSGALFVFFVPYTIMACLTYGIAVPSGLFVPSLLSGAAFGEREGKGDAREGRKKGR